jgi:serine/threonine-protein kinase
MTTPQTHAPEPNQQLSDVLVACLEAIDRGQPPDPQDLLARYPEFGAELNRFFADQGLVDRWTAPLRRVVAVATPRPEETVQPMAGGPGGELPAGGFGDYEILEELGSGGMGRVYRARQKSLGRTVALKMIRADRLASPGEAQRFRAEAEILARLDHPHIVPIYEVAEHDSQLYFTMKAVEGGNLAERPDRFAADPKAAARLVAEVARAVHHAHQHGILHHDLKPANILLNGEGWPLVTDFGLAKRVEAEGELTRSGAIVGTPGYMAPEQTTGQKGVVTTAADVYGLGAVLYFLLTGRPPFQGETVLDTLLQVREREPKPPGQSNPRVDRDLETICLKCLAKDPGHRYPSAEALAEDLERWLAGEPIRARAISRKARIWRWCRRNPVVAGLGAAAVASLVVVVVVSVVSAVSIAQKQRLTEKALGQAKEKQLLARQAVDEMYLQVAEKWLADQAQLTEVQQEFLRKALAFYEQFAREEGDEPEVRSGTAEAYHRVAGIQKKLGRGAEAERACEQELAILDKLAADFPNDPRYRARQASAYRMLGILLRVERFEGAEKALRHGIAIWESLLTAFPAEPAYRRDLAATCDSLGHMLTWFPDRANEAEQLLAKSVKLLKGLIADFPTVPGYQVDLAHVYQSLGILFKTHERARESEQAYRQGLACLEAVAPKLSTDPTYRRWLASILNNLGNTLDQTGQTQKAEGIGRQAVEAYEKLVADFPTTPEYRGSLAIALRNQGRRVRNNKPEEGCRLLERACAEQRAAFRVDPRGINYRWQLRDHSMNLADTLLQLGRHGRAAEVGAELARTFPNDLATLAFTANCLARCALLAQKDSKLAEGEGKALAQKYAAQAKQMFGGARKHIENGSAEALNDLAWHLAACPIAELRDPAEAVACARKAVRLRPKAGEHWNTLGVALYRAGDWKEAVAALQKSMELRKGGESNDWFFLAMARWQLGDKQQGRQWYDRAVRWMDQHQPQDPELGCFRAEAAALLGLKDPPAPKEKQGTSPKGKN